jgi:hypothetical protein
MTYKSLARTENHFQMLETLACLAPYSHSYSHTQAMSDRSANGRKARGAPVHYKHENDSLAAQNAGPRGEEPWAARKPKVMIRAPAEVVLCVKCGVVSSLWLNAPNIKTAVQKSGRSRNQLRKAPLVKRAPGVARFLSAGFYGQSKALHLLPNLRFPNVQALARNLPPSPKFL